MKSEEIQRANPTEYTDGNLRYGAKTTLLWAKWKNNGRQIKAIAELMRIKTNRLFENKENKD